MECIVVSGDIGIALVERHSYSTSKDSGIEMEEHPKNEYNMLQLFKHIE